VNCDCDSLCVELCDIPSQALNIIDSTSAELTLLINGTYIQKTSEYFIPFDWVYSIRIFH